MFKRLCATALVFGLAATAPPAHAQSTNCAARDVVVERLESKFGETPTGRGLRSATQMVEIWSSAETGSWSILVTRADGVTCLMASGDNWNEIQQIPAKMGTPS